MSSLPLQIEIGHRSDVGRVRQQNEDSYLILTSPAIHKPLDALLLVADGVGGANAGDVASGRLVEMFTRWFQENSYAENIHYSSTHSDYYIAVLKDLMEIANEALYASATSNPDLRDMGTTATIALLSNNQLFVGHVGDTRLYLLRQGQLQRLTADHSWVADQVAAGKLSPEEAESHPRRNIVNRVLGTEPAVRVDRNSYTLQPHDVILIASDGLTGLVSDLEIAQTILRAPSVQSACDQLVNLANEAGGTDNVTALLAYATERAHSVPSGSRVNSVYLNQAAHPPLVTPLPRNFAATVDLEQPVIKPPSNKRTWVWLKTLATWTAVVLVMLVLSNLVAGFIVNLPSFIDDISQLRRLPSEILNSLMIETGSIWILTAIALYVGIWLGRKRM